jgi:hypothetical protein
VGPIADTWLPAATKQAILIVIATSQDQGVSARRSCAILAISHRRVVRWQAHERQGLGLADATPGPQEALHRLLPEEIERIAAMAKSQEGITRARVSQLWPLSRLTGKRMDNFLKASKDGRISLRQLLRIVRDTEVNGVSHGMRKRQQGN